MPASSEPPRPLAAVVAAAAAAPGSPQVVRRKTIARQWPPAPTRRTPAPAPAAAQSRHKRGLRSDYLVSLGDPRAGRPRADRFN